MPASRLLAVTNDLSRRLLARTVLIVEDEELVRDLIARELEDAGFAVIEASTAEEGLAILDDRPVGVLFTDIRLPGALDGWRLAEEARARDPDLPVLYASGFSTEAPRLVPNGLFLRKPYLPSAVIAAIEKLVARQPD
jgi:DNA-binding response OmpR family regulator